MSADSNVATVKTIYEAFGTGDMPTILDQLTDDVDWATEAAGQGAPWYGVKKGKNEVPKFFEGIGSSLDVRDFTPLSFATNDNEVMTLVRFGFAVRSTGKEGEMNLHHYFRFRDGKVEYYRGSEDTAQMQEAFAG